MGSDGDAQLDRILAAYREAAAGGWAPPCQQVLDCYPHLAARLGPRLRDAGTVTAGVLPPPAAGTDGDDSPTVDSGPVPPPATGWPELPGYEIFEEVARGGMGVVYKARQLRANRVVALKMILQGAHAGSAERARFRTDAEAIARLQHPGVVQIHEVGEHDGLPYFSMEFCTAGSLGDYLDGTPLAAADAARVVEDLAHAVQACHEAGIIHRDLKPANVLLAVSNAAFGVRHPGEVESDEEAAVRRRRVLHTARFKVTDFGLAKNLNASAHTASNAILGTPSYMAPEQAASQHQKLGPATDVYALGAILYECLTGRPPFKAATPVDTILQVVHDDPVPPGQLQPRTPPDLERICLKCLEKDTHKRYPTARALADDLERFRRGEPVAARPLGRLSRAWRWVRRNPVVTALLAAVVAALLLGTGIATRFAVEAEGKARDLARAVRQTEKIAAQEKEAREDVLRTSREVDRARRLADDRLLRSEWLVYAAQLALAQREWDGGGAALAMHHLAGSRRDFRGWEYRYLATLFTRDHRTLDDGHAVTCVAWNPSGESVAAGNTDRAVTVWGVRTGGDLVVLQNHREAVTCLAYSPDGKLLAAGGADHTVRVWGVGTQRLLHTFTGHEGKVLALAFRPDGKRLVSGGEDHAVRVWDVEPLMKDEGSARFLPGEPRGVVTLQGHSAAVTGVAFSAAGDVLVSGGLDGTVRLWDGQQFQLTDSIRDAGGPVTCLAVDRAGKRLACGGADGRVRVWDAAARRLLLPLRAHAQAVTAVAFSHDGRQLVTAAREPVVRVWAAGTGEPLAALKGHAQAVSAVACHPEGRWVVTGSADRTVKVWDTTRAEEVPALRGHQGPVKALCFAGGWVATGGADGSVRSFDPATGRSLGVLEGHAGPVTCLAVSPDGKRLCSGGADMTVRVWEPGSDRPPLVLREHSAAVTAVRLSPDGRRLASASLDRTIRFWDPATGRLLASFKAHVVGVTCLAFSPDGATLATGGHEGAVKVWDVASRRLLRELPRRDESITCVAFSPDGRLLASGGVDGQVRLHEAATGAAAGVLKGHIGGVTCLAFHADGTRLVSGGEDRTVRVWDVGVGQEVLALRGHRDEVTAVAFAPDRLRLASASDDGTARVWEASPTAEAALPSPLPGRQGRGPRQSQPSPGRR